MHRKLFPTKPKTARLPSIEKKDEKSCIVASPVGSPTFRVRRYLTSNIDKHTATQLNYLSPIKNPKSANSRKGTKSSESKKNSAAYWLTRSSPPEQEEPAPSAGGGSSGMSNLGADLSAEAVEPPNNETNEPGMEPQVDSIPAVLLHKGNKLFWRINRTIDFRIYMATSCGAVVIRSFDSEHNCEFDPIILQYDKVVSQVLLADEALNSHQEELSKHNKKVVTNEREEDDIIKQIKRKKQAELRKKRFSMTAEDIQREQEEKEREQEALRLKEESTMRSKVAAFIIARFEAGKSKDTGDINTYVVKRLSDAPSSLEFDAEAVPVGVAHVGEDDCDWNKKESKVAIRRKSCEVAVGLDEANQMSRKASEKQKAIQSALDVVRMLSDRHRFKSNSQPHGHRRLFQKAARKAMFKGQLSKMQEQLNHSEVYRQMKSATEPASN